MHFSDILGNNWNFKSILESKNLWSLSCDLHNREGWEMGFSLPFY